MTSNYSPETAASILANACTVRREKISAMVRYASKSLNTLSREILIKLAHNDILPGRIRCQALKTLVSRLESFSPEQQCEQLTSFFPIDDLHMLGSKQMARSLARVVAGVCNRSPQPEVAWTKVFAQPQNIYSDEPVWCALVKLLDESPANRPIVCRLLEQRPTMLAAFSPVQYRSMLTRWCGELSCADTGEIARQMRLFETVFCSISEYPCAAWMADTLRMTPTHMFGGAVWECLSQAALVCGFGEVLGKHDRFVAWLSESESISLEAAFIAARWSQDERVMRRGYDVVTSACNKKKHWPVYTAQLVASGYKKARKETVHRLESMRPGERAHYLAEALLSVKASAVVTDQESVNIDRLMALLAGEDGESAAFTLTTLTALSRMGARGLPNTRRIEKMAKFFLKSERHPWSELRSSM